ncbi:hypothetical protein AB0M46_23085 [Dactylosporangium sp. NPDC051485]|uniref:hypothetical protein n=1 Tax=Dactylosporangium sp. NPDC051485 TaxID=3154846 RepID=UPI00344ABA03
MWGWSSWRTILVLGILPLTVVCWVRAMAGLLESSAGETGYPAAIGYVVGFYLLSASMVLAAVTALWIP